MNEIMSHVTLPNYPDSPPASRWLVRRAYGTKRWM